MPLLAVLYGLLTIALLPFFAYLFLVTAAVLAPGRRPSRSQGQGPATSPKFLIVIPAHEEEEGIRSTIASVAAVDYDPERFTIVVIADNCTDGTARAARDAGAVVVERHDPTRKSKGYALEYFFEQAAGAGLDDDDAVVVIDADTVVDPGLLRAFASAWSEGWDWIQGYYSVRNPDASWRTRLMTMAFSLCNGVLPRGQERLGLSVGLKGNGMCFSRRGLGRFPWKAYGLVEDMEFGLMLRLAGERVHFLPEARVYAEMLSGGGRAAASQRRRWEAGRGALRGKFLGPLLRSGRLGIGAKLLSLVELFMPPLGTLLIGLGLAASLHLVARFLPSLIPVAHGLLPVHALMALALVVYVVSPVLVMGLPLRYFSGLFVLPYYIAWKAFVSARGMPTEWIRTAREPQGKAASSESRQ
jgi:cellulose synthase/poly-beta-1,6-N-acetylglucosamine synthase-like glycosyltransferase